MAESHAGPAPLPEARELTSGDLAAALAAGFRDMVRAPLFGIFFSAVYVLGGLALWFVYSVAGQEWWLIPVVVGFPLFAPFAAVGLYEVSRRIEAGQPLVWGEVLGVVIRQKDRQVPLAAALILVMFLFWLFVAHALFALFLGLRAFTPGNDLVTLVTTGNGPVMLLVGTAIGAVFAGLVFCATVVGLPLILDREIDAVSALIVSFGTVRANPGVMALWAAIIAGGLLLAMVPMFLGLFVALPVFGHATWHLYRRAVAFPPGSAPPAAATSG